MKTDVASWVKTCVACQRAKVHHHVRAPLERFTVPERRFDHVNLDLVGPLPPSRGYTHLLTMVDRTTRWPEAVPLSATTAADVARAFISTWVARFGVPSDLSSDRGAQFTSELWTSVTQQLGVSVHRTTAYHPQANGLCERFHRSMKAALRASLRDDGWVDRLPWVMLGLRTAPKEDLLSSSAELVYGQPLRVPGDFLPCTTVPWSALEQRGALLDRTWSFLTVPTSYHGAPQVRVPTDLRAAEYVFVRHDAHRGPLRPPYDGPYRVLEPGDKNFVIDLGGEAERISVDRLKPAHLDLDRPVVVAQPPRRGRPPGRPSPSTNQAPADVPYCPLVPARHLPAAFPLPRPSVPVGEPRNRFGRVIRVPGRYLGPVLVNSGGTCVVATH